MVKKTEDHNLGNVELDDLDMDLDVEPGLEPADDREPSAKVATGFMAGVKEAVTDPNVIRRSVLSALPREYEEAYRTLDSVGSQTAGLYHQVAKDLKPAVREFKRAARTVKSSLDSYLPEAISKKLDEWLKGDPEYKRAEFNAQESAINTELAGIFKAQLDAQEETRANTVVGEQLAENRHKTNVSLLDQVQRHLSRLVAYQDSITIGYQRKSLELQYRQFYTARDQLELARGYSAETLTVFRAIQKNTALPDQVKVRGSEILGQLMQENLYGKVQESLVQNTSGFMRQLLQNVGRQANDFAGGIKDGLTGATDILDQASMIDPDQMSGIDGYEMGGRIAGQEAGEWAANKLSGWFKDSRFGKSKRIAKLGNWLGRTNESIPDIARRWSQTPTDDYGFMGDIKDFTKSLIPRQPTKQTIGLESLENSAMPVPFDKGTRRSIMTIIPGYLARILQSSERARLNTEDVPLVSFDQTRQEFVGAGAAASRILKRLLPQNSLDSMSYDSNRFVDKVLGDINDPELKKKLQTELISRSMTGRGFFADDFTSASKYKTLSKEDAAKAAELFRAAFSQEGDTTDSNLTQATRLFRRLRQSAPLIENQANAFANTGSLEMLRQLGVVTRVGNRDVIDDKFITSLMRDYIGSNSDYERAVGQGYADSPVPPVSPTTRPSDVRDTGPIGRYYTSPVEDRAMVATPQVATKEFDYERLNRELQGVIEAIQSSSSKDETTKANEVLTQILEAIQTLELSGGGPANDQAIIRKSTVLRGIGKVGGFAWRRAKNLYNAGAWARNKFLGAAGAGIKAGFSAVRGLGRWAGRKVVMDVYRKGDSSEPALLAYKMTAGHYIDRVTGKQIKHISDIKGAVVDRTTGNVVLSQEDFQNGMVDSQGKELVRSGIGWAAGKLGWAAGVLGSTTWKSMTLPFKLMSGANWVRRHILMRPSDVYVPGEQHPRLLAVMLLNGGYFSKKTGRPIRSVGDIDSDVVDSEGNVKLSLAEFAAGVVDWKGKPIRTVAGRIKGLLSATMDLGWRAVKFGGRQIARGVGMVGSVIKGTGKLLMGMAPNVHFGGKFGDVSGEQTDVLVKIHNLLCRHFGEEDQVIDSTPNVGGGLSRVKRFGQATKAKYERTKEKAQDVATSVSTKMRSIVASALGKDESELDGKDTMWERLRRRANGFRANSAADLQAKRAAKGSTPKAAVKATPEKSGILGKLLMAVMGIGGLLTTAVGKLGGLLTSFWELRKVLLAATAAKAGAEALDTLGGLGDVEGPDGKSKTKRQPGTKRAWLRNAMSKEGLKAGGRWLATRGAMAAGATLAAGGAVASTGASVVGGTLGVLFSAPVLIGLAVGGAGYGLYRGYRHLKGRAEPMERARFAQYGIDPDTNAHCLALMEFEELVMPYVTFSGKQANIEGNIDYVAWMEHFGFDPETASHKEGWGQWYQNRFKPVFLRWVKLTQLTDASANVRTLDSSLKDEEKSGFIRKTKFARREIQPYPYDISVVPFLGESSVDEDVIDAEIMAVWKLYKDVAKEGAPNGQTIVKEGGKTTVTSEFGLTPKAKADSPTITMGGQLKYISQGQADASPVVKRSSELSDLTLGRSRVIDDLTALRVKTYGLTDLDVAKVNVLLDLEDSVIKELKIQSSGQATFEQPTTRYYEEYAGKFGLGVSDLEQMAIWQVWFLQRFVPVVLNYVAAVHKIDRTANLATVSTRLTATQLLAIAEAVRSTKADVQGNKVSVWNVNASPFVGYPINTDAGSVRGYITSLQNRTTALSYKDPMPFKQEVSATGKDGLAAKGGFSLPKVSGAQMPVTQAQRSAMAPAPVYKDLVSQTPVMLSGKGDGGSGTYREIPRPKGSGNWNAVKDTVVAAAKAVGVDPALLGAMAKIESTFRTDVVNPATGASGMFQFLGSTWEDMQRLYGQQYGVPPDARPTDPVAASLFAANYIKWNMDRISSKVSRPLTATDLYAAHFLGHAGAVKLLKSDPNAIAADVFPGPARTNPNVFYKAGRPVSIAELYQYLDRRVSGEIPPDLLVTGKGSANETPSVLEANGLQDPNMPIGNVGGMTQEERKAAEQAKASPVSTALKQTSKVPGISISTAYAGTVPDSASTKSVVADKPAETPAQRDARIDADVKLRTQQTQRQQVELARAAANKTDDQLNVLKEQLVTQQGMSKSLVDILALLKDKVAQATDVPKVAAATPPQKSPIQTTNPKRPDFPVNLNRTA